MSFCKKSLNINKLNLPLNYSSEHWDMETTDIDLGRLELVGQLVLPELVDELEQSSSFAVQHRLMELGQVQAAEYMPIRMVVDSFPVGSPDELISK